LSRIKGGGDSTISFIAKQKHKSRKQSKQKKLVLKSQPELQKGINLIQKPDKLPVFQSLITSELEKTDRNAVWIDTRNESSTYALSSYGCSGLLEKVKIGRAFTPFQHHNLVHQLEEFVDKDTELVVLPHIDHLYLDGQLRDWEAQELFEESWDKILQLQDRYDLKIIVSANRDSSLYYYVSGDADNKIRVDKTTHGWKYDSEEFDQMIYRDQGQLQTTMPYWFEKLSENIEVSTRRF